MDSTEADRVPARGQLLTVPDLSGTPAADAQGQFFGEVYGALAESGTGLIRYLDVDLHQAARHVLVPIGHVRVPRAGEPASALRLRAATVADLATIPAIGDDRLDDETEEALLAAFGRFFAGERYYAHPAFDHSGLYASEQPLVGAPPDTRAGPQLLRLSELAGFELAEGEPDVRGWRLRTRDSIVPGEVTELVADPEALQVRYAVVRLKDDREVLVPIGYLELDTANEVVRAPSLLADDVRALPGQSGSITRADEDAVRAALEARLSGRRRFLRADFLVRS